MSIAAITTLAAAFMFTAFHVPVPRRTGAGWTMGSFEKWQERLLGIGYHILMLPAVALLPAPSWAVAAGYAWMLIDTVLDTADLAGTAVDVGPFREGTHVVACVWLVCAGWATGPVLGVIGSLHAAGFLYRLALTASNAPKPSWMRVFNTLFNILWMLGVAVALW